MQEDKISIRTSKIMQRAIEKSINDRLTSKPSFIQRAVTRNIDSILEEAQGQKSLRDFTRNLDAKVEWIHITPPELNIRDKIQEKSNFEVTNTFKIDSKEHQKIKAASRYTDLSKSSIIRVCIIKELYDRSELLMNCDERDVNNAWLSTKMELNMGKDLMVDKLYYNLDREYIESKLGRREQAMNLMNLCDVYNEFKDTDGYEYMLTRDKGEETIRLLNDMESKIVYPENQ